MKNTINTWDREGIYTFTPEEARIAKQELSVYGIKSTLKIMPAEFQGIVILDDGLEVHSFAQVEQIINKRGV